ncbi:hypothetical protein SANA_28440 [Gottschalkiaceae bacterium SANA]|nr:hypothetical protein SANA_28440 [Gottschalkiaceae bacterium SANA]
MKRLGLGLLIICIFFGSGIGFSMSKPEEEPVPTALDERVSEFYVGDFFPGDVKYLSDGNVVIQTAGGLDGLQMKVLKVDEQGNPVAGKSIEKRWLIDQSPRIPLFTNFLIEDIKGNIYTLAEDRVMEISADFLSTTTYKRMPAFWFDVESKGRTMVNMIRGFDGEENILLAALTYEEGESPAEFNKMGIVSYEGVLASLNIENGSLAGVDFGQLENELYLLVSIEEGESKSWIIIKTSLAKVQMPPDFEGKVQYTLELEETIALDKAFDGYMLIGMEYTGNGFHITGVPGREKQTEIHRVDMDGSIQESVDLPGQVLYFDSKGSETIVSVTQSFEPSGIKNGYYKVEWDKKSSTGSPNRLIRERSFGGKTTAVFCDGGYGLFQKDIDESGAIDYLAPLRTKESEVRLRMPLCDVLAKLNDSARNLEILFGEDRILIPMTALAVEDLLAQMPCETDATVEIHLIRGEDGTITVRADLFVVEQVDGMTKLVHRRAIQLP